MVEGLPSLLSSDMVELDPPIDFPSPPEEKEKEEAFKWQCKELVLKEVVRVMCKSPYVHNESKLFKDLLNREKQATTGVGQGLAIPHVRTKQPSELVVCFLRFRDGVEFMSLDNEPIQYLFGVITPPYDDKKYFNVLSWLGKIFTECYWLKDSLLACETPEEARSILISPKA